MEDDCLPSQPISVLHLHGDADETVFYGGGTTFGEPVNIETLSYPGAVEVTERWAEPAGCGSVPVVGDPLDLVVGIPGAETVVAAYAGCAEGVDVQLDTIEGGGHIPLLDSGHVGVDILDWLLNHTR